RHTAPPAPPRGGGHAPARPEHRSRDPEAPPLTSAPAWPAPGGTDVDKTIIPCRYRGGGRRLEPAWPGPRHPGHELALPPSEAEDHGRAHGAGAGARPPGPCADLHRPGPDRSGRGDGRRGGDAAPHPGALEAH